VTELHDLDALTLATALRRGDASATDVLEHTLERAERLGPAVGAFVTLTPDLAREQARAADDALVAARRDGTADALPPFLGVPLPIKDLTMVAGVPMAAGSAALQEFVAPVDDGVVTLLRDAGTVMVGKTNTPELGLPPYTEPDVAPPARTPWDLTRSAGGSSGGAAAAVASRIVPVAHGNDGGGSLRIPASATGLVGLKPSRGRVSWGPHAVDGVGLAAHGVLTRTVRDTAAFLDVLAVNRPGDTFVAPGGPGPAGSYLAACDTPPRSLRVGVLTAPVIADDADVDPACLHAVDHGVALLDALGHDVAEAPVPFPAEDWAAFAALWSVGALSAPVPAEAEGLLTPLTRWLRATGHEQTGLAYAQAFAGMQRLTQRVASVWEPFDVVLTPTLAQLPAPIGSLRDDADPAGDFAAQCRFTPWTCVAKLTGRPSVSLPLGWTDDPLPVGVMLTGRLGDDALLLALSAQLEAADPWQDRKAPEPVT
jgi:amidase